jgi:histidinol phosphatase-like enzyme
MIFAVREYGADIDAVYVCPHQKGTCNCRKPKIGLFLKQKRILILIDLPVG